MCALPLVKRTFLYVALHVPWCLSTPSATPVGESSEKGHLSWRLCHQSVKRVDLLSLCGILRLVAAATRPQECCEVPVLLQVWEYHTPLPLPGLHRCVAEQ